MRFFTGLLSRGWEFAKSHWTDLVAIAVSAAIFTAIVWLAPVSIPTLATLAIAGFVSGAAGSVVGDLLEKKKPTIRSVLLAATISTVLAVGSFGIARWVKPHLPRLWKPISNWLLRPTLSAVGRPGVTIATKTVMEVGEPLVASAIRTVGRSVGFFGSEIARNFDGRKKPDAAPDVPMPSRGPPPSVPETPEPPSTNTGDDDGAGAPRSQPVSPGLLGALSKTHR